MLENKKINIKHIIVLSVISVLTYAWTIDLPIVGDGLMHMADHTDLSVINILKSFWTFEGLGKPENGATLVFHRPIFDEIIVELLKRLTNYNVYAIHFVSILVHSCMVVISYLIGDCLFTDKKKAIFLALIFNFSLTYFSPMYEWGLSFSLWLTCFVLLAFYETVRYVKNSAMDKKSFALAYLFTGLALFTKESAMTLGIALTWYVFWAEVLKKRKVTRKAIAYGSGQLVILVCYLITRKNKLGTLFVPAAGLNVDKIVLGDVVKKIVGYWFYALNIPTHCFEAYMCAYLDKLSIPFATLIFCFFVFGIEQLIKALKVRNRDIISLWFIFLGIYFILLMPVLKTNRNSVYYGDLVTFFVLVVLIGTVNFHNISGFKKCVFLFSYVMVFILNVRVMTSATGPFYLKPISNDAKTVMQKCIEKDPDITGNSILLSTNWYRNSEDKFIYNDQGLGNFYKYNVNVCKDVDIAQDYNMAEGYPILDYWKALDTGEVEVFVYSEAEDGTKRVKVDYDMEANDNIQVGFGYQGKYYYSVIDVKNKSIWSSDNSLYFVIPAECSLDLVGLDCQITYLD